MKLIDKFLKKLNTSRNTFATYILTLISVYLMVDRVVEMLIMTFTGVSVSYWGPIGYTLALACVVFAFLFSGQSEFGKSKNARVTLFYIYVIALYVIAVSMFTQFINGLAWILFLSVPNYTEIITEFSDLVKPAFCAMAVYLPIVTFHPILNKLIMSVHRSTEATRSLWDYRGIGLTKNTEGTGTYSCEVALFPDKETGKMVKIPEGKRFQQTFVCGASGSGKTTFIFEPMIARDIEKKYFFREVAKEMGYTALKTGVATLKSPYDNDYLNENFSLGMLIPVEGKEKVYKEYMKKLVLSDSEEITYRDLGITCVAPDFEIISHMMDVCDNYKIKYNLIDPSSNTSLGLNPFVYDDPTKIAITISSILKGMYLSNNPEKEDAYSEDITLQAVENLTILLKEIYPRMHEGVLPNLEDMLKLLINHELVIKMCKILEADKKLSEKYEIQLAYFKRNFYKDGVGFEDTQRAISASTGQLDNLLRTAGVKSILCNRHNNINFDDMLANGEVTFVCTRRGDLGTSGNKAFGLFFLLSMQNSVLSRPGFEASRIPHFLYMDEFPPFICRATNSIFTMYRKYKVGIVISSQSLAQLGKEGSSNRSVILANCRNKVFTGGTTPEEAEWWWKEFNQRRRWKYSLDLETPGGVPSYTGKYGNIRYDWEDNLKASKLLALPFKQCGYEVQALGRPQYGQGLMNSMDSKYKEPKKVKIYDFGKYGGNVNVKSDEKDKKYDTDYGTNPIKMNENDSRYFYDNEDAFAVKIPRGKKAEN